MKKIILTALAVCAFGFTNAQSHQKGDMQVNIMGGLLMGSATSQGDAAGSPKEKFSATGAQFGANFQYGLAESFSAGIGLEVGTAILSPKDNTYNSTSTDISTFKFNVSGRYYFLNKEKFNIYAGPSIGYTSGKDTSSAVLGSISSTTKYSGLNFGVNAGCNYFFNDHVGIIVNLGYEGNGLKSTTSEAGYPDETGKSAVSGVKVMGGLALKF
ncbi:outer membrane protein [Flavobacterium aciduliphilum]|uniref:Outer membrane protein with beta-barrel domain n=1 Tax=Flavobacterium aciduliphilum TaxID=1101402 RepID=A0A328YNW6_9FLAO|nr:outer membrane beta-barrel protein [Flavobacterium aciduliphilum]RAR75751.1 outer membrane protein with beta-barrel domain [Flavobacterium aciduliphilum]